MATEAPEKTAEETKPTPVFGSGTAFGAGGGFGGFAAAAASGGGASANAGTDGGAAAADAGADGDAGDDDPEAECTAEFKPVVQLEEVETSTGEEDEECLLDLKCKLYRFDGEEWKERGIGQARLLRHKENQRTRLLMRQEKTLKIRANHIVMPGTKLQEHAGSDKAWVWSAVDFSEGEQRVELFCIRFGSAEKAQDFKAKFDAAGEANAAVLGGGGGGEGAAAAEGKGDADAAAADALADEVAAKAGVGGDNGEEADKKAEEAA